jgi:hypothetical protein
MEWSHLAQKREMWRLCADGSEIMGFRKWVELLDQLRRFSNRTGLGSLDLNLNLNNEIKILH